MNMKQHLFLLYKRRDNTWVLPKCYSTTIPNYIQLVKSIDSWNKNRGGIYCYAIVPASCVKKVLGQMIYNHLILNGTNAEIEWPFPWPGNQ
jgi:hypothetical protein